MKSEAIDLPLTDSRLALLWGEYDLLRAAEIQLVALRSCPTIKTEDLSPGLTGQGLKDFADLEHLTIDLVRCGPEGLVEPLRDFDKLEADQVQDPIDVDLANDYGALRGLSFLRAAALIAKCMGGDSGVEVAKVLIRMICERRLDLQTDFLSAAQRYLASDARWAAWRSPNHCEVIDDEGVPKLRLKYFHSERRWNNTLGGSRSSRR